MFGPAITAAALRVILFPARVVLDALLLPRSHLPVADSQGVYVEIRIQFCIFAQNVL